MGGGIAARFVEMYPEYFAAAVLSAPMMEVDTGSVNATLARTIANSMVRLGKGVDYVLGQGPYEEGYILIHLIHSRNRCLTMLMI